MAFLIAILTLALIALVLVVVGEPLRRARQRGYSDSFADATELPQASPPPLVRVRDELESAREAKYREIRDAELDFRTGKLSAEDYRAIDADLRAEAIEILNRLESVEQPTAGSNGASSTRPGAPER